jgi:ABC-type phosphate transport system substrate-binding protein
VGVLIPPRHRLSSAKVGVHIPTFQHSATATSRHSGPVGVLGGDVWPIAAAIWIVLPRNRRKAPEGQGVTDFFRRMLHNGATLADSMGYTPMPEKVVGLIDASLRKELQ